MFVFIVLFIYIYIYYYKQILLLSSVRVFLVFSRKINFAKHLGQGIIFSCSCCWILWWNWNIFHQTSIISVSRLSLMLCFPTNSIFGLLVTKISMSVLIKTSVANWFFGDGDFTGSSSRRSSKSFQKINSLLRLNYWKIMTSALSPPTQAYLPFVGLLNAC